MDKSEENVSMDEVESLKELADLDGAAVSSLAAEEFEKKAQGLPGPDQVVSDFSAGEEKSSDSGAAPQEEPTGQPEQPASALTSADVFGVSENELQTEFNRFKADKLFKKIYADFTDPYMDKHALLSGLKEARALGLGGSVILPNTAKYVAKSGEAVGTLVAVDCPYGADTFKNKKYLTKQAIKSAASGAVVYFDLFGMCLKKKSVVVSEYKKLCALGKKKQMAVALDLSGLSSDQVTQAAAILADAGVGRVFAIADVEKDAYDLSSFIGTAKGKVEIIAALGVITGEQAAQILSSGADGVSCRNASEVTSSLKDILGL